MIASMVLQIYHAPHSTSYHLHPYPTTYALTPTPPPLSHHHPAIVIEALPFFLLPCLMESLTFLISLLVPRVLENQVGGASGASAGLVELTDWLGVQKVLQGRAQGVRALAVEISHQPHQQQYSHTTSPIHIFAVMCNN